MIGKVSYVLSGVAREAVMEDSGEWTGGDPLTLRDLNECYSPADGSPADGARGVKQLNAAAEALGGRATSVRAKAPEPGAIH